MNIVLIAGSNRPDATSAKLAACVGKRLRELGASVELFELYRRPIPFYEPDYIPGGTSADDNLAELLRFAEGADAFGFSTPEYHGGPTGLMKNAIDWLEKRHVSGKAVLAMASAGGAVAVSTLQQLQTAVRYVHGINCPEWISLGGPQRAFADDGEPTHPDAAKRIDHVARYFHDFAKKQAGVQ
ncbi:NAD(P)H-dependent oxidoreductase [Paenibacillus sp.]|uniref:NADPH-dependent FMN reductase n=1 Tax=Paenibacillus sp. TaxID=58172 RepID=UPI002812483D|nr:NAD(P)H-dependent oxidoreductase [Paenibacillus sp.]